MNSEPNRGLRAPAPWSHHVCPRIGAAPLRFHGRLLDSRDAGAAGTRLFVQLYLRKTGGMTVAMSRLTDCGVWADHAFTTDDLPSAMLALEAYCTDLGDELADDRVQSGDGVEALLGNLLRRGRLSSEVRQFCDLVGVTLDGWYSMTAQSVENPAVAP